MCADLWVFGHAAPVNMQPRQSNSPRRVRRFFVRLVIFTVVVIGFTVLSVVVQACAENAGASDDAARWLANGLLTATLLTYIAWLANSIIKTEVKARLAAPAAAHPIDALAAAGRPADE
jgi:hypothetical protein